MKKIIFSTLAIFALMVGMAGVLSITPEFTEVASAQALDEARSGAAEAGQNDLSITQLIRTVLSVLFWGVGVVAVIMIVVGGFRYVISSGDPSQTKAAKDTILYAVVGLAIAIFAQAIIAFIFTQIQRQ